MDRVNGMGNHLLIIVPHQDDEILLCAGVIRHAAGQQIPVDVVMVTNGDYGCRDFSAGRTRLRETLKGLELLGVSRQHIHILGYADTGMPEADSFLTHLYQEKDGQKKYSSFCTDRTYGLEEKPEYHWEKYGDHANYCRDDFKSDLREIIAEMKADCIITTADCDQHGDHSALYRFICEVLDEQKEYAPDLLTGLVHSGAGDEIWPERGSAQYSNPGNCLPAGHGWEDRICVHVPEEMNVALGADNLKYQALLQYETALEPGAYDFLMAFIKNEEIFWRMRQSKAK